MTNQTFLRKEIEFHHLFIGDSGFYTCTGTNHLGSVVTTAELVVNNENWGPRK